MEELNITPRTLMGPGPSDVSFRVLKALSTPLIGHLDPQFLKIMDHTQKMLRALFQTENKMTLAISGTGTSGMEACFVNLLEKGDKILIGVNGVFGSRMVEISERCEAEIYTVTSDWGKIIPVDEFINKIRELKPKVAALVHAETSTGVLQPLEEIGKVCQEMGTLLLIDCVTSLGGCPVKIDEWGVDAAYSGTQKCLSCPPGLSPVTFSDRAMEVIRNRTTKVQSWYLDLTMLDKYWGSERVYHHTAPISMNYALYEALRIIFEEGLEKRFARHKRNHELLVKGLQELGFRLSSQEGHRLPMLNAVIVPDGIDEAHLRKSLLTEYNLEIGAGLGPLKGKILRIGLMGESCTPNHVELILAALRNLI